MTINELIDDYREFVVGIREKLPAIISNTCSVNELTAIAQFTREIDSSWMFGEEIANKANSLGMKSGDIRTHGVYNEYGYYLKINEDYSYEVQHLMDESTEVGEWVSSNY